MGSLGRLMDWTMKDSMVNVLFFCATLTSHSRGHTLFMYTGAETSDISAEAVKLHPCCSWQAHSRRVGADVRDESKESCSVLSPTTPNPTSDLARTMHFSCFHPMIRFRSNDNNNFIIGHTSKLVSTYTVRLGGGRKTLWSSCLPPPNHLLSNTLSQHAHCSPA